MDCLIYFAILGSSENHRLELEKVPDTAEVATHFHDTILSIFTLLASAEEKKKTALTHKLKDISDSFRLCMLIVEHITLRTSTAMFVIKQLMCRKVYRNT